MWSILCIALAFTACARAQVLAAPSTATITVYVTTTISTNVATVTLTSTVFTTALVTVTEGAATTSTSTSTSDGPVVTDQAYIDTILRHHNLHRINHTSPGLTWDDTLAEKARLITDTCIYHLDTSIDCPTNDCYGQNVAAGFPSTEMGALFSEGFYNGEVNNYLPSYYGGEPDYDTYYTWGHFSQIVWTDTQYIGCYTTDCSDREGGLDFPEDLDGYSEGVRPLFTVCNYQGPGNYAGQFAENVLEPIGLPSIEGGFGCPTYENCEDGAMNGLTDEQISEEEAELIALLQSGGVEEKRKKNKV